VCCHCIVHTQLCKAYQATQKLSLGRIRDVRLAFLGQFSKLWPRFKLVWPEKDFNMFAFSLRLFSQVSMRDMLTVLKKLQCKSKK